MTKDYRNIVYQGDEIHDIKKREALLNEVEELTSRLGEWEIYFCAITVLLYLKIKDRSQIDMNPKNSKLFQSIMEARTPEDFHVLCAQWISKLDLIKTTKGAK
jgi:hypothetical protein